MQFDDIIVGSGSSGAVLAARLSEDEGRRVLLIEAGPDYPDIESTPGSLLDGRHVALDHDWGFTAEMVPGRSVAYARGKAIGGSSSVNACIALRGTPADYDEWRAFGNADWDWVKVLPSFRRMEDDPHAEGDVHGTGGPIPISRYEPAELTPAQSAFISACETLGFPNCPDNNHPEATGVGNGPWNHRVVGNQRIRGSTAIAYLLPARQRSNLAIRADCLVDRVVLDGNRAVGVEVACADGSKERFLGARVTLSAGAFGSPAILLRSGIGPASEIEAIGIEPSVRLAGVGRNLIDHCTVEVAWETPPGIVTEDSPYLQVLLRYTAQGSAQDNDMQIIPFQELPQPALALAALLMKPFSRGTLRLRSKDPKIQPDIQFNFASEPEDTRRLVEGLKLLGKLALTPELEALGAKCLKLWNDETIPAERFVELVEDESWAEDYVRSSVWHYVHAVGTARMGSANDPGAVVDQHGRVHGVSGLRVVDASIMPTIPRANTNLTCIMIGERVADWMRREDD